MAKLARLSFTVSHTALRNSRSAPNSASSACRREAQSTASATLTRAVRSINGQ